MSGEIKVDIPHVGDRRWSPAYPRSSSVPLHCSVMLLKTSIVLLHCSIMLLGAWYLLHDRASV